MAKAAQSEEVVRPKSVPSAADADGCVASVLAGLLSNGETDQRQIRITLAHRQLTITSEYVDVNIQSNRKSMVFPVGEKLTHGEIKQAIYKFAE